MPQNESNEGEGKKMWAEQEREFGERQNSEMRGREKRVQKEIKRGVEEKKGEKHGFLVA